jgi:hypothetical protein
LFQMSPPNLRNLQSQGNISRSKLTIARDKI